jgi:hypothetical protein
VSRNGTLLPLPVFDPIFVSLMDAWPDYESWPHRSDWLSQFETHLHAHYPQSSSADRKLTARHYAPFPLRDGHDVP